MERDSLDKSGAMPTELLTNKTLYTLSGASAAVWIICLVIHNVFNKTINNPDIYKILALSFSLFISMSMVFKKTKRSYEDWVLGVVNGFLIFIYSVGFNTISGSQSIPVQATKDATSKTIKKEKESMQLAGFFGLKDISWFPNKKLIKENRDLKIKLDSILRIADNGQKRRGIFLDNDSLLAIENVELKARIIELDITNSKIASQGKESDELIKKLKNEIETLRKLNSQSFVTNPKVEDRNYEVGTKDLNYLQDLNKGLLKNLEEYINLGPMNPQQKKAYRTLDERIDLLRSQLLRYNAKIDEMRK